MIRNILRKSTIVVIFIIVPVFSSCWDSLNSFNSLTPPSVTLVNGSIDQTSIHFTWNNPTLTYYSGMKVIITTSDGTTVDTQIIPKSNNDCTCSSLSTSTRYTVTLITQFSTGLELEGVSFKVTTLSSGTQTLNFIYTAAELKDINTSSVTLGYYYVLMKDIDLSGYTNWTPIGDDTNNFTGTFDGNSHVISNLSINNPSTDNQGLFGYVTGGTIEYLGLTNISVSGGSHVGGLVGHNTDNSTVTKSYATGTVTGSGNSVGGLVGYNINNSTVTESYATSTATGSGNVGGLVGFTKSSSISNSYATGSVTGSNGNAGGLVGYANTSPISFCYATGNVEGGATHVGGLVGNTYTNVIISYCYATGSVKGSGSVGGLVGYNFADSHISCSYASGTVEGTVTQIGGLVGYNYLNSTISNSYATGSVSGTTYVGGLVGYNNSSTITNCYATGSVTGSSDVGGFAGSSSGTTTDCFYDTTTTGDDTDTYATGVTTTLMKTVSTFTDTSLYVSTAWDFVDDPYDDAGSDDYWSIDGSINGGYPYLTELVP